MVKIKPKILLVDVDSKIPNIALMKISSYYKAKKYDVELKKIRYSYYPHKKTCMVMVDNYEKVYVSTIFKQNIGRIKFIGNSKIIHGGVGYSLDVKLPKEIESIDLDYSIYPNNDISYGFITRGCIRNCYFCVVPKKEGFIHKVNEIDNIVKHKKVRFLDNNILAYNKWKEVFLELINKDIKCSFNEGLDIRLITDEKAKYLSMLNYYPSEYIFAFDKIEDLNIIEEKLKILKKYIKKDWKIKFFIYCHPNMDIQKDLLFRINWCINNKVLPYIMRDSSCWLSTNSEFYIDLSAYCNQPSQIKKKSFEEFMKKRTNNIERQQRSIKIFNNTEVMAEQERRHSSH